MFGTHAQKNTHFLRSLLSPVYFHSLPWLISEDFLLTHFLIKPLPARYIPTNTYILTHSLTLSYLLLKWNGGSIVVFRFRGIMTGRNTFLSAMVPGISSSQSLERLAGTAAIIGLSLAAVIQWLSPSDESDVLLLDQGDSKNQRQQQQRGDDRDVAAAAKTSSRTASSSLSSWWWPIAMMKRRKNKRRTKSSSTYDDNNDNTANRGKNADASKENSSLLDDGYHDHLGSCQCGSIRFIVSIIICRRRMVLISVCSTHQTNIIIPSYAHHHLLLNCIAQGTQAYSSHSIARQN